MPLRDEPSGNFVKFFTRKRALLGEDWVPGFIVEGSGGLGACSQECFEGVSGG
jgi:hypothetical protein